MQSHAMHARSYVAPKVEGYLVEGDLSKGERELLARLDKHADDDQARFGLGMLQFLRGVEGLFQDCYRYGLRNYLEDGFRGPFWRVPLKTNPHPETVNYQQARAMIEKFEAHLKRAEANLGAVTSADVKLPLHFGLIRLDLDGDGVTSEEDSLWRLYTSLTPNNANITEEQAREFFIKFDRGDVHWLRGYCNVFLALCNMFLAYDSQETFDRAGQLLYVRPQTPFVDGLCKGKVLKRHFAGLGDDAWMDLIALAHSLKWKLVEPTRMEAALHNWEMVIAQSRETWKWIMAETDDDHEWLPNPRQTGVLPGVRVTDEMVHSWMEIMDENEKILAGKLLIPFWRGAKGEGVNVRRIFLEPRDFELAYWVQGSDALPYVEVGPLTRGDDWRRTTSAFGNHFPGFAFYFN
ncbi:MAG: hypothetical protein JST01_21590 [Cyanobacteria bacterium SZAS TMP-1]|nr:hypothetical protein [Cyanobacteria bacterium SZAS TMP-1]